MYISCYSVFGEKSVFFYVGKNTRIFCVQKIHTFFQQNSTVFLIFMFEILTKR